jgi:hypothetical protein
MMLGGASARMDLAQSEGSVQEPGRGVGSMKRRQAVLTMSCELALLHGRPYDLPGCAASANP